MQVRAFVLYCVILVYMTQYSMNALNCILIFSFNCHISFIPDDGLCISQNVE